MSFFPIFPFPLSIQDDRMQPGDEVYSGQDRQRRAAGSQEEKEGGGGGGQEEVGQRQQALLTPLQAQGEPENGDPEETSSSRQGAAARGPGMKEQRARGTEQQGNLSVQHINYQHYDVYKNV